MYCSVSLACAAIISILLELYSLLCRANDIFHKILDWYISDAVVLHFF